MSNQLADPPPRPRTPTSHLSPSILAPAHRPMGPRSNPRSVSPAPFPIPDSSHNRRPSVPSGLSVSPSNASYLAPPPARSLKLQTPGPPAPSSKPKLGKLALQIPASNSIAGNGDTQDASQLNSAFEPGGYYGGPLAMPSELSSENPGEEVTMRPPSHVTPKPPDTVQDIEAMLRGMKLKTTQHPPPDPISALSDQEEVSRLPIPSASTDWSDAMLEEIARLGEGAGGAVHHVKDKKTGTYMARKTITTREAPMKQLLRELDIISSTAHPNIVLFYGAYMSPSSSEVKILMEYCPGLSLESIGKRMAERGGRVGEKVAGRLAEGVLQGLAYLHSKKTIHRDIKPSNILLSREGIVKLCDFGVSGELVESWAGTFTGTSFYMAPERISGKEYTIRSDVWSTGITLLELVQQRFPFPNDVPPIELIMLITAGKPPQLEDEPEADCYWSDEMKDFIRQTLIMEPTRPSPKEILNHPWIISNMKQEVKMAVWIRQVWDWPKPAKRKDGASRPGSSRRAPSPPALKFVGQGTR